MNWLPVVRRADASRVGSEGRPQRQTRAGQAAKRRDALAKGRTQCACSQRFCAPGVLMQERPIERICSHAFNGLSRLEGLATSYMLAWVMEERILDNWLRVLDTAECSQVDQRVCQQLQAIMPLLYTFKS